MAFEMKPDTGSLFKNEKKEKENHPDYKGECLIDGTAYWMSAWIKKKEGGRTWMSFSFQAKEDTKPKAKPARRAEPDDDSDVPW